ncbi:aldehyde dehydrogenase family protein, partial [bacterium]|nr:aldehyde dehydrogenase family protein [bacterium]
MQNQEIQSSVFPGPGQVPQEYAMPYLAQKEYLINGEIKFWQGNVIRVKSPVCLQQDGSTKQQELGSFPELTESEAQEALVAAQNAYDKGRGAWPTMKVRERIACMEKFVEQMKAVRTEVVNLLMWEIGKNLDDSRKEFDRTVEYILDTIAAVKELDRKGSRLELESGIYGQIKRGPLGVVFCMGPYNYPLNETFATLIPALIMGNTTILKPAKYGVLLLQPLLHAFKESFPAGVVNVLYGRGSVLADFLMRSGQVDVLAFIGSTKVANMLKKAHPKPNRLRAVLGLEAKNPAIVMADCDIDLAVSECVTGSLSYNGQRCTALKILFVHESLHDKFIEKFTAAVAKTKVGMPWENAQITPLPEPEKPAYLNSLVNDAIEKGAQLIVPHQKDDEGTMVYPKVLLWVNKDMRVYHEEQFGPVIPVVKFSEMEEAIDYLTYSPYGQQVSLFSDNYETLAELIDPMVNQVCRVNINSQCQ